MKIETDVQAGFGLWKIEGNPQSVEFTLEFWAAIVNSVMADFLRLPYGGTDVGGVLFGARETDRVRILAYRPLECEHAHGPSFQLTEHDEAGLRRLLDEARVDPDLAGLQPVGWYHSKHRWLLLTPQDTAVYERYFPEPWQLTLVFLRVRSAPCLLGLFFRQENGWVVCSHREFNVIEAQPEIAPEPCEPEAIALPPQPEAPVEEAPVEEAPVEEAPVEEAPVEEAPVEEAPVEEAPVEEAPVEEVPVEEAPVAEPIIEPTPAPLSCCAFFGLSENPFSETAHPASPYWSPSHKQVMANLLDGVRRRRGLMLLTGVSGTGKTTLLGCLGDLLAQESIEFAFLLNSRLTVKEFYEFIAYDLDLRCGRPSKLNVLRALEDRPAALIVDDAQELDGEVLEEIRLFDNLQNRSGKLLQTILCGLPELDRRLETDGLYQLKQRVVMRCRLLPLNEGETLQLISDQLAKSGMAQQAVFTPPVMAAIHARSGGIPRVIGAMCDELLESCFATGTRVATMEMLDRACGSDGLCGQL
jgi:general secretion pathway protein A